MRRWPNMFLILNLELHGRTAVGKGVDEKYRHLIKRRNSYSIMCVNRFISPNYKLCDYWLLKFFILIDTDFHF